MSAAEISSVLKNSIANLPESSYYKFKFSFFFDFSKPTRQQTKKLIKQRPLVLKILAVKKEEKTGPELLHCGR